MAKTTLKIEFANDAAAEHFAVWLCEQGEQDYWSWMEYREKEEEGFITATSFLYHGPKNKGEFLCDDTIRTKCGRLDEDE